MSTEAPLEKKVLLIKNKRLLPLVLFIKRKKNLSKVVYGFAEVSALGRKKAPHPPIQGRPWLPGTGDRDERAR